MKIVTIAVITLVVLGFTSLGFTLIKEQTQLIEAKQTLSSKDKRMMDEFKLNQLKDHKGGNELASFD